jgi:hypothetical protein
MAITQSPIEPLVLAYKLSKYIQPQMSVKPKEQKSPYLMYDASGEPIASINPTPAKSSNLIYEKGQPVGSKMPPMSVLGDSVSNMTNRGQVSSTSTKRASVKPQAQEQKQQPKVSDAQKDYERQVQKQIEEGYKQQIDFLKSQQSSLEGQLPTFLEQVSRPFEMQEPLLQQQLREQEQRATEEQLNLTGQQEQALAQARRAGEEQAIRATQLFGGVGGSSAGQASAEILGREQIRQMGNIREQTARGVRDIQNQLRTITAEYNQNVAQLRLQKEQALGQARTDFQRQIDQIKSERAQAGVTKAQRTLDALGQFAQRRQAIEDQERSFELNLRAAREQAQLNAQNALLASSIQTQQIPQVSFAGLFQGPGQTDVLGQSNEAKKLLQSILASGNPSAYGLLEIGQDPVTGERLFQDPQGLIIDSEGNRRSGVGQFQQQMQTPMQ